MRSPEARVGLSTAKWPYCFSVAPTEKHRKAQISPREPHRADSLGNFPNSLRPANLFFSPLYKMDVKPPPTILLVEDEVSVRNFYQLYLEHHGFRVLPASSMSEALRTLQRDMPAVILVDIFLGADNGLDLLRGMHRSGLNVPAIVISGLPAESPLFEEALEAGAVAIYSKTRPISDLLSEIRALLRKSIRESSV